MSVRKVIPSEQAGIHSAEKDDQRYRPLPSSARQRRGQPFEDWRSRGPRIRQHAIDGDGLRDILGAMVTQRLEARANLMPDMVVNIARNRDAAGLRQRLETTGNVDALAKQAIGVEHHVAEIDADPEDHLVCIRQVERTLRKVLLELDRGAECLDR